MNKPTLKAFQEPGTYIIGDIVVRLKKDGTTSVHRSSNYRKQEVREGLFNVLEALFSDEEKENNIINNRKSNV